ncbi:DgyrCDS9595 [Dimorphilus gyrociliatus]|uniref:Sialin n=1 Tax=Dimorphilus gyrociliatus TaxID=2664684 RepID=A0A7I8W058_9ANNE|nr:DgyrCDS9595 [Dimorphilus gyrociliatus]
MSNNIWLAPKDSKAETWMAWKTMHLARAKLKASSRTSALLSGFAMVVMVEASVDYAKVGQGLLIVFSICTVLVVGVHLLALMISTCMLPNIEAVASLNSMEAVNESPHMRLRVYVDIAWLLSTFIGILLFLVEMAILGWIRFLPEAGSGQNKSASIAAIVVIVPVIIIFLLFAAHFYKQLIAHKMQNTAAELEELNLEEKWTEIAKKFITGDGQLMSVRAMRKDKIFSTLPPEGSSLPWWCSIRLLLAFVGFLGFVNLYALRVNMSVAIVCMVNNTALSDSNSTQECEINSTSTSNSDGEFVWDRTTQGYILGSFFYGYAITQIPGGWLAQRFGGKRIFGGFMLMTAIATLLTPVGAEASVYFLITLRFIKGLGQGVVFPCMHSIWAKWAPPLERTKLVGLTYAGAQIGNVITFPISGFLCQYSWTAIFYAFGAYGVVWFLLWTFFVSDSPETHRQISQIEKDYIIESTGTKKTDSNYKVPWLKIFKSKAVWAIIVAHTCSNWGTYLVLTGLPTYFKDVLHFDMKSNGLFSALPYIGFWAFISFGGIFADFLRKKRIRTVKVRKLMTSMGTILPGTFLLITAYIPGTYPLAAVAGLTIAVGFSGFQYAGVMTNHIDIAPRFAGLLFGISNTAATIPGFVSPLVTAALTSACTKLSCEEKVACLANRWLVSFFIAAAIYLIGAIFYCIFAQGEIQDWAESSIGEVENSLMKEKCPELGKEEKEEEKTKC